MGWSHVSDHYCGLGGSIGGTRPVVTEGIEDDGMLRT
jgi:hypothetical protein